MSSPKASHAPVRSCPAAFDAWASAYERALEQGLKYSGEGSCYFAFGRVRALATRTQRLAATPVAVLDFGCGTGATTALLAQALGARRVIGVDVSTQLLERARAAHGSARVEFRLAGNGLEGRVDVVYCNGVFHHLAVRERSEAVDYVYSALRPGGLFAFFENNPLNPGTRLVMASIPFDRDAVMVGAREARGLLTAGGFEVLTTAYLFVFPRALRALRRLEPHLERLPIGAQYMVLCRKPRENNG